VNWELLGFAFLTGMLLYSAFKVVTTTYITHAAIYLAFTFVALAGFFLMLSANFLAAVQILVYAGAVVALVVFAIMLSQRQDYSGKPIEETRTEKIERTFGSQYWGALPLVIAAGVAAIMIVIYRQVVAAGYWTSEPGPALEDSTVAIANELFTKYLIPFEVVSLVLLAAMIGAIILTKREGQR